MEIMLPKEAKEQPPLYHVSHNELNVAIASLSLGGAERIVLDWASRIYPRWKTHLIVLRDRINEWPVPSYIRITRLRGRYFTEQLQILGRDIVKNGNGVCICHLLQWRERVALIKEGVHVISVLHNAKEGWPEDAIYLKGSSQVITVSDAALHELRESGWTGPASVIRHIPKKPSYDNEARTFFRKAWNIPQDAVVIGMVGAVKKQKNYGRALSIFRRFLEKRDAYLVIVGGPVAKKNENSWKELVININELGLRHRVALPGFVPAAADCLPAFDLVMNTSDYEGLSMATLEALGFGLPVVATAVGGQGEITAEGFTLISSKSSEAEWVSSLERSLELKLSVPLWVNFPAYRQWTLAAIAKPFTPSKEVLFVTANLSSGGAQRSLVNLAKSLAGKVPLSLLVVGNSTTDYFYKESKMAGVKVERAVEVWDAFSIAESIVDKVVNQRIGAVCFWNVDARVKLLSVKALAHTAVKFVEVSPGDDLFGEMAAVREFQNLIAFSEEVYYQRIDRLVLKFNGAKPLACMDKTIIIPNGVSKPRCIKIDYSISDNPRIVVNGRIAPAKYIVEIIRAMRILWQNMSDTELHLFGGAEHYHTDYANAVLDEAADDIGRRIFFHGARFDIQDTLWQYDAYVVLGKNQGCPNALLEALAAGLPSVGNDDGGTREQLIHGQTGILIKECDPVELAYALRRILTDRVLAKRLGINGREHVMRSFSMNAMVAAYTELLADGHKSGVMKISRLALSNTRKLVNLMNRRNNQFQSKRSITF